MGCRASDLLYDDRPDAVLRFETDVAVTRFWGWLKGRMNETKTEGKKQVPKYKAEDLLRDVDDDPSPEEDGTGLWLPPSHARRQHVTQSLLRGDASQGRILSPEEVT